MPRLAATRDLLRTSRRRRTARPRRNAACPTARMAAAADLMASGSHLVIPHLDGIPTEHRFHAGRRASIRLAQTLLEVGIADPTDWRRGIRPFQAGSWFSPGMTPSRARSTMSLKV